MSDTLKIENEKGREQREKLLRNCSAPCMIPMQLKTTPLEPRRKSENSLLGSFHRIRASFGSKDGPNGVALSRLVIFFCCGTNNKKVGDMETGRYKYNIFRRCNLL